jgi:hypothetical protein
MRNTLSQTEYLEIPVADEEINVPVGVTECHRKTSSASALTKGKLLLSVNDGSLSDPTTESSSACAAAAISG